MIERRYLANVRTRVIAGASGSAGTRFGRYVERLR
jgi:hypothetical protein